MMEGWEIKKLEEACEMYQPKTISKKEMADDGEYSVFGANGVIGKHDKYNHEDPQLLITCRGATCGSVNISTPKSWINGNAMVVRPKDNSIDLKLLEYMFRGGIDLSETISGAAQPQITRQSLNPVQIAYPKSLPEQQRIVSILDQAYAAIDMAKANAEQNLKNAKELFESYLQGVVSNGDQWEKKTLAQIAKTFGRGKSKHRPRNWEGLYGGDYPFIQTGDIRNSMHYITKYSQTYNEVGLAQSKLWPAGTICITIAANIAETGVLTFDACFPDSVIGIEVNEKFADREFVEYLLQSFKVRIQALGKGSAQANINLGTFENELFPFPPVAEQKEIVDKLNQLFTECERLENVFLRKIHDLEELKKSILQKAFAGELTSSVSTSMPATKVIPLQKMEGISPTDLQAGITALALQKHIEQDQQHSFHHVKAEKIVHLSEYILNIDLNRNPVKDAAGPNDFPHAKKVESRARKAGFYSVYKNGEFYDYRQGNSFNKVIQKAQNSLGEKANTLSQIIDILAPMSTQHAEVVATVYAAWNNLLLTKKMFSDEDIVTEAREKWHENKLAIERDKFFSTLKWMRKHELLMPKGNGKVVETKVREKK